MATKLSSFQKQKMSYRGNASIRPETYVHEYTQREMEEFEKCANDPIYFIKNYCKIISLDKGIINFNMFDYQEKYIKMILSERKVLCKLFRQGGKTTCTAAAIVWYIIFNDSKTVGVLGHKASAAREVMSRILLMYELLPQFLKHGVKTWNKGDIELSNGSIVFASATSASAGRGKTINWLYLDEFAFVQPNIAEEFFTSVFPTLSSGNTSKITITSTPIGLNHFWKMWVSAEKGISGFTTFTANYWERPGYDLAWAEEQKRVLGELKFRQEIEMEWLGSSLTLIRGDIISKMTSLPYAYSKDDLDISVAPIKDHSYVMVADTSRGVGGDYSAFTVIDVTEIPYSLVAKYRNNKISPMLYPSVIHHVATSYNNALVLVEINDIGGQVADILYQDLEYENMFFINKEKGGQRLSAGFGRNTQTGIRTDKQVKRLGCSTLKSLIEENKFFVTDPDAISEFSTFTETKLGYFAADIGYHDDIVITLVLFSWMTTQPYFKELTNGDLRKALYESQINNIELELTPFGIVSDGLNDEDISWEKLQGEYWQVADAPQRPDDFGRNELKENWHFF